MRHRRTIRPRHQRQEPRQHRECVVRQPVHAAGDVRRRGQPRDGCASRRHREGLRRRRLRRDFSGDAAPNAAWAQNDYLCRRRTVRVTDPLDTSYEKAYWGLPGADRRRHQPRDVLPDQPLAGAVLQVVRRGGCRRAGDGRDAAHGRRRVPETRRRDRSAPDAPVGASRVHQADRSGSALRLRPARIASSRIRARSRSSRAISRSAK
jgi:hypothetical protein